MGSSVVNGHGQSLRPRKERKVSIVFPPLEENKHFAGVEALVLSPEQQALYTASRDSTIKRWDVSQNSPRLQVSYEGHVDWVNDITLINGSNLLVSCSNDQTVRIWEISRPEEGRLLHTATYHSDYVTCVEAAPAISKVVSAGLRSEIFTLDIESGQHMRLYPRRRFESTWRGVPTDVPDASAGVSYRPGAAGLAPPVGGGMDSGGSESGGSGSGGGGRPPVNYGSIFSLAVSANGSLVAAGTRDHYIRLLDARTAQKVAKLRGHADVVKALALSDDGQCLLSGGSDGSIKLWSVPMQRCIQTISIHHDSVWALKASSDFTVMYSGGRDGAIYRTHLPSRTSLLIAKEDAPVRDLAFYKVADNSGSESVLGAGVARHHHIATSTSPLLRSSSPGQGTGADAGLTVSKQAVLRVSPNARRVSSRQRRRLRPLSPTSRGLNANGGSVASAFYPDGSPSAPTSGGNLGDDGSFGEDEGAFATEDFENLEAVGDATRSSDGYDPSSWTRSSPLPPLPSVPISISAVSRAPRGSLARVSSGSPDPVNAGGGGRGSSSPLPPLSAATATAATFRSKVGTVPLSGRSTTMAALLPASSSSAAATAAGRLMIWAATSGCPSVRLWDAPLDVIQGPTGGSSHGRGGAGGLVWSSEYSFTFSGNRRVGSITHVPYTSPGASDVSAGSCGGGSSTALLYRLAVCKTPAAVLPAVPPLVRFEVLNDKRHVLTMDAEGQVALWDVLQGHAVENYGKVDFVQKLAALFEPLSMPSWFSLDLRLGTLCLTLEPPGCFATEEYATSLGMPVTADDVKVNYALLVLNGAFAKWHARSLSLASAQRPRALAGGTAKDGVSGYPSPGSRSGSGSVIPDHVPFVFHEPWPRYWELPPHAQPIVLSTYANGQPWRRPIGRFQGTEAEPDQLPCWVTDTVVRNAPPPPLPQAGARDKCSFHLLPAEGSNLPQLQQSKLNAPRILQVHKVASYCQTKLAERGVALARFPVHLRPPEATPATRVSDPDPHPSQQALELTCAGMAVPYEMSIATVKQYIWRRSDDLVIHFGIRDPARPAPLPVISNPYQTGN